MLPPQCPSLRLPSFLPALAAALLLLNGCGKPTYPADRLEEAVREVCLREYKFDVTARLAGKTLYVFIEPQSLVGADLGLDRKTIEHLYQALLTATRVALSTDAQVDFLAVKAKDTNTGVTLTLLRHVPDIKWYFYARISRADFERRGIMEIDGADADGDPASVRDVTLQEFMARLLASSLQQKITYNPLVSVFVRVHRVKGSFRDGILTVRFDKFQRLGAEGDAVDGAPDASDDLLRRSLVEEAGTIVKRYDEAKAVRRVKVVEDGGRVLFDFSREELLDAHEGLPKKKFWEN